MIPNKGCGVIVKRNIATVPTWGEEDPYQLFANAGHEWLEFREFRPGGSSWVRGIGYWPQGWYKGGDPATPADERCASESVNETKVISQNDPHTGSDHGDGTVVWDTTRTSHFGGENTIDHGAFKRTKCTNAQCAQILQCLREFVPSKKWEVITNDCRRGVQDALSGCCLTKLPGRQR